MGAFVYSPEEGTRAASFPDLVPREVGEERYARLMELQSELSRERSALFVGRELDVLVEEVDGESGEAWGRSYRDAPEVDGMVYVSGAGDAEPGTFVRAFLASSRLRPSRSMAALIWSAMPVPAVPAP